MALFHALGLGVAIIVLQVLVPDIWNALERLILTLLSAGMDVLNHLQAATATPSILPAF